RDGAEPGEPGAQVLDRHGDVVAQPLFGDVARGGGDVEQVRCADLDVLARVIDLVGILTQDVGEDLLAELHHAGVGDPGAVEAVAGLAGLIGTHLLEGDLVDLFIPAGGERRQAPARVRTALVAAPHAGFGVGPQARNGPG